MRGMRGSEDKGPLTAAAWGVSVGSAMTTQQESLPERVSRLEGAYEHLATKADIGEVKAQIAEIKVEIAHIETRLLRWLLPTMAAGITAAAAVSRLVG